MPKTKEVEQTEEQAEPKEKVLWNYYRVTWNFLTILCGQTPEDPNIIKKWLEAREPKVKPAGAKSIEEINDEVMESVKQGDGEPDTEFSKLVFQRNAEGFLSMRAATVKAHLKDCARVLSVQFVSKVKGERAFSTRVINGVYHDERTYFIPVRRSDGTLISGPDGHKEKPIHARGMRGEPINAIKCFDYIENASMVFIIKVLGRSVTEKDLRLLFEYGGTHGYAGERSDGEGRYTYELERLEGQPEVE